MKSRGASSIAVGIVGVIALAVLVRSPSVERTSGPLASEAYVWQRQWDGAVKQAVRETGSQLVRLVVLAAEVGWRDGERVVVRVPVDYDALRASGSGIGLALRVGPYSGSFEDAELTAFLGRLTSELLDAARSAGVEPTELQIDFDCASSKLDGYRRWVEAIRGAGRAPPVVITALPAWLDQPGFRALAAAADGFVLQVHSLERPAAPDAPMTLCGPVAARRWVEEAARFGRPFRVALPTYGYLVAFDADGGLVGLSAEGPRVAWSDDVLVRELRADPVAMASLVRSWREDRPALLEGVIWYRLPTSNDERNWRWPTLTAVMKGETPRADLQVETRRPDAALVEVDLINRGNADASLAVVVSIVWSEARLVAGDALGGFEWVDAGPASAAERGRRRVRLRGTALALERLRPGERRSIGWLRLTEGSEVTAHVVTR